MTEEIYTTGKLIFVTGLIIALIGGLMMLSGRMSWPGRLPGDILIQKKNITFYFPIATSILLSLLLTLIFRLLGRR
jgi:hypothetical protein